MNTHNSVLFFVFFILINSNAIFSLKPTHKNVFIVRKPDKISIYTIQLTLICANGLETPGIIQIDYT